MSYTIHQTNSAFYISEENLTPAFTALKALCEDRNWYNGLRKIRHLEDAVGRFGWNMEFDDDGNISDIKLLRDYAENEQAMFSALAPYVKAGSFIQMSGEENEIWRWVFDGATCVMKKPTISW